MIVQKYGGSSVATLGQIKQIAEKIRQHILSDEKMVVVVSARGKRTNQLIQTANEICVTPNKRAMDMLLTIGETETVALLTIALIDLGIKAIGLNGEQAGIVTIGNHQKSFIRHIDISRIKRELSSCDVVVVAGFQGKNENGDFTTLGRGGSDTTAVALASKLKCPCDIYTDVDGVYSCDPKILPNAKKLDYVSYDEMVQMAVCGARVLDARCIELAKKNKVELYLGKSLEKIKRGTRVTDKYFEQLQVTAIAVIPNLKIIQYRLSEHKKFFEDITKTSVTANMMQVIGDEIMVATPIGSCDEVTKEIGPGIIDSGEYAMISVIGEGLATRINVLRKIMSVVDSAKTNATMLTATEGCISLLVNNEKTSIIVNGLAEEFDLVK